MILNFHYISVHFNIHFDANLFIDHSYESKSQTLTYKKRAQDTLMITWHYDISTDSKPFVSTPGMFVVQNLLKTVKWFTSSISKPCIFYHSFPFAKTCNVDLQTTTSYQIVKSVIDVNNMYCILFTETVLARLPMAEQAMRWKSLCLIMNDTLNNEEMMSFIFLSERNLD